MSAEFQPPPRNMVQEVRNIIDAYKMGSLRALAQDPVQNGIDAYAGSGGPVKIEYQLLERTLSTGESMFMLTVSDSNTTGLRGSPLSLGDLQERAVTTGYLELAQDENWAAWEAMGYTKAGEDKLGSRGQGKAAFLYHSRRPLGVKGPGGAELEGMVMLYDTLLADGSYRLGVRMAQPADLVRFPPFEGEEAREAVRTAYTSEQDRLEVPLLLSPLEAPGTRIIVPFLSTEAVVAFRNGEMHRWLQRCWWRAIQIGRLEIAVEVDGVREEIGVPGWWENAPWDQSPMPRGFLREENVVIEAGWSGRIKRIVLAYDQQLDADEIDDVGFPQYAGVQLLRGQQWIETLGARERFGDLIPPDRRNGFRGFVEFDRAVEGELREVESPQHDGFERRRALVKQIDLVITEAVRNFSEANGWIKADATEGGEDKTADDLLRQISELFVHSGPKKGSGSEEKWQCQLDVDFPTHDTTRVEWGEGLSNMSAVCRHDVSGGRRDIRFDLVLIDPMGQSTIVETRNQRSTAGRAGADFSDVTVVKVATGNVHEVVCGMIGRYRLRVECFFEETRVVTASRNLFVHLDPPEPLPARPVSLEIAAKNSDADRVRINSGEHLDVEVTIKNRRHEQIDLRIDASLEELLFHDSVEVGLPARLAGDVPPSHVISSRPIEIRTDVDTDSTQTRVRLEPGRHMIRVDARDGSGKIVASAAKAVWVEADPDEGGPELPFHLEPRDSNTPVPIWELTAPHGAQIDWVLEYTRTHPAYRAAIAGDTARTNGQLIGRRFFFGEMICSALIEWALTLYREHGDEGGFQLLIDRAHDESGPIWEGYRARLEELQDCTDEVQAVRLERAVVSLMLYAVDGGGLQVVGA